MSRQRKTSIIGALGVATVVSLILSACTPGTAAHQTANVVPSGPVITDPAKMGNVELQVVDTFSGGTDNAWMSQVVSAFEKKYPNIKIDRTPMAWNDAMDALPLKLKSGNPPDIVPANNGWQSLGTLVQGDLVLNLDSYAAAYGWRKEVPPSVLTEHEFSPDGKQMGTGSLFGMPVARSSTIEVYYNRALLAKLGLGVPKSYSEFVTDLAKSKAAGITPIAMGNVEQVGVTTPLYSVMDALGDQKTITDLIYSNGNASIDSPASGFPQAVAALKDWADKGYFTNDFAAVAGQDAAQAFVNGQALFHFDYSGSLPLQPGQGAQFGSFILPRDDGKPAVATTSSAANFSVSSKSKNPGAAALFLNFAASPAAAQIAVNDGTDPMLAPNINPAGSDPLFADEIANAQYIAANNTSVPYLDWATPTLLQTVPVKLQDLLAGRTDVNGVISAAKADDEAFRKTLAH